MRLARLRARRRSALPWRRAGGATLDLIAGYGYAPGRALLCLVAQFDPLTAGLYTIDPVVPTSPLGQQEQATTAAINVLTRLHVNGWMLSIAIVPAVTRALGRRV